MPLPPIKRSTANKLAKAIRDSNKLKPNEKDVMAYFLANFFRQEDPTFRDDIFFNVASGKLATDPAIKNPTGNNQWSKS